MMTRSSLSEEPLQHHHGCHSANKVNLANTKSFFSSFRSDLMETFLPDDPFRHILKKKKQQQQSGCAACSSLLRYFVPTLEWPSTYTFAKLRFDLLAGIAIASLAIPQGISYARLANLPPILGLWNVAAASLLLASIIGSQVSATEDPQLHLHLFFTAAFFTGIFQLAMGIFRMVILVDFLSRSTTITGFMGGTAIMVILQQLKGVLGLKLFTTKTDVVSVLIDILSSRHEVGPLDKGVLNPVSISNLIFESKYVGVTLKAGLITGILNLSEGIAVGRSLAMMKNKQIDGNKEMIALGMMNIVGSWFSCYLTTGWREHKLIWLDISCNIKTFDILKCNKMDAACMGY